MSKPVYVSELLLSNLDKEEIVLQDVEEMEFEANTSRLETAGLESS